MREILGTAAGSYTDEDLRKILTAKYNEFKAFQEQGIFPTSDDLSQESPDTTIWREIKTQFRVQGQYDSEELKTELNELKTGKRVAAPTPKTLRNVSLKEKLESYKSEDGDKRLYKTISKLVSGEIDQWFVVNVPGDGWCTIYATMIGAQIYNDLIHTKPPSPVEEVIMESVENLIGLYEGEDTPPGLREKARFFLKKAFTNYYKDRQLKFLSGPKKKGGRGANYITTRI